MKETATQINERKIRNGIRKQREKIEREQQKVWDRLKDTSNGKRKLEAVYKYKVQASSMYGTMHGVDVEQELADILSRKKILLEQEQSWELKMEKQLRDFLTSKYNARN